MALLESNQPPDRRETVLIVDDEPVMQDTIEAILKGRGWRVLKAGDSERALDAITRYSVDVVILDIDLAGSSLDGMGVLEQIRGRTDQVECIMCTVDRSPRTAVRATKLGAYDYLTKDYEHLHDLPQIVRRALERQRDRREILYLRSQVGGATGATGFVPPRSLVMKEVVETLLRVARTPTTVLLLGESGTGKEMLARLLHVSSPRLEHPFVAVNLASIEKNLMSSELFGHEKGAFTGADRQHIGRFELAQGGTLFLDEIGDLALDAQGRLLRAIQEREIERVGGTAPIPVDLRLVVATNRDLAAMVERNEFREDLYYRIRVVPVHVPPLRERRDDIPDLVNFFVRRYATLFRQQPPTLTDEAMATLIAYDWPGNIRELENLVQQILATRHGKENIDETDIPALTSINRLQEKRSPGEDLLRAATRVFERQLLTRALERTGWNVTMAARYLGLPNTTMKYKCKKHGLTGRPRTGVARPKPPA
jgi:DNA-binding NtrC family response regulator